MNENRSILIKEFAYAVLAFSILSLPIFVLGSGSSKPLKFTNVQVEERSLASVSSKTKVCERVSGWRWSCPEGQSRCLGPKKQGYRRCRSKSSKR